VGAAPAGFVIEADLLPARVYVGAEAILRLRLVRAPGVHYGMLRPPALGEAAEMWPLGPIRWFETERAGVIWQVHERTYVVVPLRAGGLVVPGAELEGPLRASLESGVARGPRLVLEVRAPPAGASEPWLPARRLTLEESWSRDPSALSAGTPVTRTVVLRADGIPAQRLPQLEMAAHPALRVHHDRPDLVTEYHATGATGHRIQRIVLVPLDEGELLLPELSVRWWDVGMDAPRIATLPGRTLRLRAALPPPAAPEVRGISTVRWMAAAFALLLAAMLWWRARTDAAREARKQLRAACRANDPRSARAALIEWWNVVSPDPAPPLVQRIGAAWDAGARAQLSALDASLYGRRAWNGKEFWRRVRPALRKATTRQVTPAPSPGRFFRLQAGATADGEIARQ
jgi:hypothetical protein